MREIRKMNRMQGIYESLGNKCLTMQEVAEIMGTVRQNLRREILEMIEMGLIEIDERDFQRPIYYKKTNQDKEFEVTDKQYAQRQKSSNTILKLLFNQEKTLKDIMPFLEDVTINAARATMVKMISDGLVIVVRENANREKVYLGVAEEFKRPEKKSKGELKGTNVRVFSSDEYHTKGNPMRRSAWIGSSANII